MSLQWSVIYRESYWVACDTYLDVLACWIGVQIMFVPLRKPAPKPGECWRRKYSKVEKSWKLNANLQRFLLSGQHSHHITIASRHPVQLQCQRHQNTRDEGRDHHKFIHQNLSFFSSFRFLFFFFLALLTLVFDQLRFLISCTRIFFITIASTGAGAGSIRLN